MIEKIKQIVNGLNLLEAEKLRQEGYTHPFNPDRTLINEYKVKYKEKKKYFYIDFGTSGAFMVNKETGLIYNIKGYGQINKNKCLGNIKEIDIKFLHSKRWNYLR